MTNTASRPEACIASRWWRSEELLTKGRAEKMPSPRQWRRFIVSEPNCILISLSAVQGPVDPGAERSSPQSVKKKTIPLVRDYRWHVAAPDYCLFAFLKQSKYNWAWQASVQRKSNWAVPRVGGHWPSHCITACSDSSWTPRRCIKLKHRSSTWLRSLNPLRSEITNMRLQCSSLNIQMLM